MRETRTVCDKGGGGVRIGCGKWEKMAGGASERSDARVWQHGVEIGRVEMRM